MTRRRRPTWSGWYVCEWSCGRRYRRGADYNAHVLAKHCDEYGFPHPRPPAEPAGDGGCADESPNYARAQRVNRTVPGWRGRL